MNIIASDWPVFADKKVNYIGEAIGLIVGPDKGMCMYLASLVKGEYEELEPVYEMKNSYVHKEFTKGEGFMILCFQFGSISQLELN